MYIDPFWYLFALPGLLLGMIAQFKLSAAYHHYSQVGSESGLTGAEAARAILDHAGLSEVPVREIEGHLTDHYDSSKKALFVSSENYHGQSLAAIGVAAHEAGHALQHQASYAFLNFRMWLAPATGIATSAVYFIVLISFLFGLVPKLVPVAVAMFAVIALFQLITLPVEFDASRRAKEQLAALGLVRGGEIGGVKKVLSAAALTYVAAMVEALMELFRWILVARSMSDRD